jgi:hypothetical protein
VMNRWVCEADEWHRVTELMGQSPTESVEVEVGRLGSEED